jgi:ornithine cyclodeaminase/alanine dehydrogenase-like protein (mu-crystallin family)
VSARSRTLALTRRDVAALLDLDACIGAVERAFRLHEEGRTLAPAVASVASRDGGFHVKAAGLAGAAGRRYFAAKVNGNFPGNPGRHGLPTIQGVLVLADADDGRPLAVMDSIEITLQRTGAATAVAAKHLARPESSVVMVYGCGEQGRVQLRALSRVLRLQRAHAFDVNPAHAQAFAREMSAELRLPVEAVAEPSLPSSASDVVLTCTTARRSFLRREHVAPGAFVAAVGADNPDKQELDPGLLAASTVVVDVLESCAELGELHHALEAGLMTRAGVHATLAEVVAGRKPARRSPQEVIVFDSTGTALQDVAAAALVYERASEAGRGLLLELGG